MKTKVSINEKSCPSCKVILNDIAHIEGEEVLPKPGDISICFKCGTILEFTPKMNFKFATAKVLRELNTTEIFALEALQKKIRRGEL